jgi:hypothetical protein
MLSNASQQYRAPTARTHVGINPAKWVSVLNDARWLRWENIEELFDNTRFDPFVQCSEDKKTVKFHYGEDLLLKRETEADGYTPYAPNYPYLVTSTTGEIILDHNTIYDENFTDFLCRFYLRHIRHIKERINFREDCFYDVPACLKTDITLCQRSCRREGGSSCSGRRGLVARGHPSGEN